MGSNGDPHGAELLTSADMTHGYVCNAHLFLNRLSRDELRERSGRVQVVAELAKVRMYNRRISAVRPYAPARAPLWARLLVWGLVARVIARVLAPSCIIFLLRLGA